MPIRKDNKSEIISMKYRKLIFLFAGPLAFLIIKLIHFEDLSNEGQSVLASTAWVAIWWITEAIELEVTSLLPLLLFPLSKGLKLADVTSSYGHPFIFLFLGGFIIGLAIEKWSLHERIAYTIIRFIGTSPKKVILGFMVATAFLSMWISNTATAVIMLPIALSIVNSATDDNHFSKSLMLGIAYAASIGGMATLIGSPPNIIFAGIVKESIGLEISFLQWMILALPLSIILLSISWLYLSSKVSSKIEGLNLLLKKPGNITVPQKRVTIIFAGVALLWITQSFAIAPIIPQIDDTIIGILGAVILFIIPSGIKKEKLMDWNTAKKLPWGILLIFGAGLSIAKGFSSTDLTTWLAGRFLILDFVPVFLLLIIIIASINFLTEITSNTATASMVLPLLITLGAALNISPLSLMVGAVIACSCAFMLPVATPPNAIVFSSGKIKIKDMVKSGIWMNLMSIILIFLFVWFLMPYIWNSNLK
jgi:sodium-dependent dicarboxylate transporter 2/3/5